MRALLVFMVWLSSSIALGAGWKVDSSSSAVTFTAIGNPGFLRVTGEGAKVSGGDTTFTVALGDLKTGIAMRDQHMKEKYLETAKFPDATLVLKSPLTATGAFTGALTLHGVTKDVSGKATITPQDKRLSVVAEFKCKLSDFQISKPGWEGVTVAEDVTVHASFMADPA